MTATLTLTSGYRYTGNFTNKRRPSIDDRMYMETPRNVPLQTFLKRWSKQPVDNDSHILIQDMWMPYVTAINLAAGYDDAATSIVVDDALFVAGDIIKNERTGEVLRITAVSTVTLTVTRGFGTTSAAQINDNDVIRWIGNAMSEAAAAPDATYTTEAQLTFYVQDFETSYKITEKGKDAKNYTGGDLEHQKKKKLKEHGEKIELALLHGEPKSTTENQSTGISLQSAPLKLTGGLLYHLDTRGRDENYVSAPSTITKEWFIKQFLGPALDIGSDRKFFFVGGTILEAIDYWKLGNFFLTPQDKSFDMTVSTWVFKGRNIKIIEHQGLNKPYVGNSAMGAIGIMLDAGNEDTMPQYLEQYPTREDDMVISGVSVNSGKPKAMHRRYYTACGLAVPDPTVHHALVGVFDYQ